MVRVKGLEPPRPKASGPKPGASTNFATPAYQFHVLLSLPLGCCQQLSCSPIMQAGIDIDCVAPPSYSHLTCSRNKQVQYMESIYKLTVLVDVLDFDPEMGRHLDLSLYSNRLFPAIHHDDDHPIDCTHQGV